MANSGTWLCSYIPKTKNIIDAADSTFRTSDGVGGSLKLISEFDLGVIDRGVFILTLFLGDRHADFTEFLPGLQLKWPQELTTRSCGVLILISKDTQEVQFTLKRIQYRFDFRTFNLNRIHLGPVSQERLR